MIEGIHISQEIFAIDMFTALKPSLEHDRKHALRLLRLYGDQALKPGFHYIVTRSWDRTIQACFDLLLKDQLEFMATLSFAYA